MATTNSALRSHGIQRHIHQCVHRVQARSLPPSCFALRRYHVSRTQKYGTASRCCRTNMSIYQSIVPSHFGIIPDELFTLHSFRQQLSTIADHHEENHPIGVQKFSEESIDYLPDGVTRQSDFFGEAITFVTDVDGKSLGSVDHSAAKEVSPKSPTSSNQTNNDNDDLTSPKPKMSQSSDAASTDISDATASFDGMSLCILSRGSANIHTGNDADGPDARAFHASSLAWSEILRYAWDWNCNHRRENAESITSAPMLVVASAAPALAQGGSHYLRRIDKLLDTTTRELGTVPPSLWTMAHNAASFRDAVWTTAPVKSSSNSDDPKTVHLLTSRERWHLHALHQLLQNNHQEAMGAYLRLLELFPGDLLALSLALDVAYTIGDASAALRAATNVSTYWMERDGGALRLGRSHPAQNLATSLISVGLSSSTTSSRASSAESMAELAIARDSDGTGGTSVWALSHCLASEGRSSEMVSKLAGFDGTQFYEACGFLHFNIRMRGYGGIATLDCKRGGSNRSAVRMYDGGFGNVLDYSGNNVEGLDGGGEERYLRDVRVPRSIKENMSGAVSSLFTGWFSGSGPNEKEQQSNDSEGGEQGQTIHPQRRTIEDVLCWIPPSPLLLTHATALLFRLTLCDAIPESDQRWANLRAAWTLALKSDNSIEKVVENKSPVEFMPLALLASSLVMDPNELHSNGVSQQLHCAMQGLHKMGKLMKFGQLKMVSASSLQQSDNYDEEWREVLKLLARARDSCQRWEMPTGISSSTYLLSDAGNPAPIPPRPIGWDLDMRQFLEYALCHAAMQVGDYESLCLARAICSEGTTLRANCPELWWRYGSVLDMLGDEVAAENARSASISLGSGEGGATY